MARPEDTLRGECPPAGRGSMALCTPVERDHIRPEVSQCLWEGTCERPPRWPPSLEGRVTLSHLAFCQISGVWCIGGNTGNAVITRAQPGCCLGRTVETIKDEPLIWPCAGLLEACSGPSGGLRLTGWPLSVAQAGASCPRGLPIF